LKINHLATLVAMHRSRGFSEHSISFPVPEKWRQISLCFIFYFYIFFANAFISLFSIHEQCIWWDSNSGLLVPEADMMSTALRRRVTAAPNFTLV
jgi:hypothetical protein